MPHITDRRLAASQAGFPFRAFGARLFGGLRRMFDPAPHFVVGLIDARTGDQHSVGGLPIVVCSPNPDAAIASLMRNRDPCRYRPMILRNPAAEAPS